MTDIELTLEHFNEDDKKALVRILNSLRGLDDKIGMYHVKTSQLYQRSGTLNFHWDKTLDMINDGAEVIAIFETAPVKLAHIINKLLGIQPEDPLPHIPFADDQID